MLNVNFGSIACSQLLQTWPGCVASKCIQGRREPTLNSVVSKHEPDCTVWYARDHNVNVFHLCHVSCRTVPAREFGDGISLPAQCILFSSSPLTVLLYLKAWNWFWLILGLAFEGQDGLNSVCVLTCKSCWVSGECSQGSYNVSLCWVACYVMLCWVTDVYQVFIRKWAKLFAVCVCWRVRVFRVIILVDHITEIICILSVGCTL